MTGRVAVDVSTPGMIRRWSDAEASDVKRRETTRQEGRTQPALARSLEDNSLQARLAKVLETGATWLRCMDRRI